VKNKLPNSEVKAMELSKEAISLLQENIAHTEIEIDTILGDALQEETYKGLKMSSFDCWVSNPPYIPNSDKKLMHQNVLGNEPHMALFVEDEDPLIFYRRISMIAKDYLKKGGFLFFEIHEGLGNEVISLLKGIGFVNIELRKDLQGKDRMVRATK
jgi:release factor glutamine methyltransferase